MTTTQIFSELFSGEIDTETAAQQLGCQGYELEAWLGLAQGLTYEADEANDVAMAWEGDEAETFPLNDSDADIF